MLLYTGQTVQNVSEDQFVFLVRLKLSELLEIKKEKKKMEMLVSSHAWGELFWSLYAHRFQ